MALHEKITDESDVRRKIQTESDLGRKNHEEVRPLRKYSKVMQDPD